MVRLPWPEFANRWLWLCPLLAVALATFSLWSFGFGWWSSLVAALLVVCPVLILWGAIQATMDERRSRRRLRH